MLQKLRCLLQNQIVMDAQTVLCRLKQSLPSLPIIRSRPR